MNLTKNLEYLSLLAEIKNKVKSAQIKAAISINRELLRLYWEIGKAIAEKQKNGKWGDSIVDALAVDLRKEFPEMKGFSRSNLQNMRLFYINYPKSQTLPGELRWSHYCILFEYRTESRKAVNTSGNNPYDVRFNLGNSLKPNGVSVKSLPLNSGSFTDSNKLIKDEKTVSTSGGLILINIIPEYFSGGNNRILPKCLSNDSTTLPSELASSAISSSSDLKGAFFTSKPSSFNSLTTLSGTFSSEYNCGLLEDDIFLLFNQLGSVINSRKNSFLGKPREIVLNDFIYCDAGSNQVKNLPDHDSGIFECRGAVADFAVNDNVFVDFNSHSIANNNSIFKTIENKFSEPYFVGFENHENENQ